MASASTHLPGRLAAHPRAVAALHATPWWQIQPDIQYVFNPCGGLVKPNNRTQRIRNELVLGLRTNILF